MEFIKKRIAIFLDGTWNVRSSNTNVWRLKSLCTSDDSQIIYYSEGVGTKFGSKIIGGMFGWGLDQEIINAYEWLIENYNNGDELFIFGFSRGAYTARSLSGLISKCGLLKPGSPLGVTQLYKRYRMGTSKHTIRELISSKEKNPNFPLLPEEQLLIKYALPVAVKFLGVWDTVGALGIPFGSIPLISRSNYGFLEIDLRINNDFAYQALAIDEHRKDFQPSLWTRIIPKNQKTEDLDPGLRPLQQVEQRWFVGAHANVGGGYDYDFLAQLPLKWIMGKAISHGLSVKGEIEIDGTEYSAAIADSYGEFAYGIYKIIRRIYYRPIGNTPVDINHSEEVITINETIDESVFERWRKLPEYRPDNLVDWEKRYKVDIKGLQHAVRADQPDVSVPDSLAVAPI